ncbi:MAG: serine/threonine-protein kinase [Pirellulales bacterium]
MTKPAKHPRVERPRFRETALASGLLDDSQVATAEREIGVVIDAARADTDAWDRAVADRLVTQGLLTPFQAREMLAGRRRFRLGQYTVLDEIAKGGMGQVFRAEHAMMGREVAVKVLPRAKSTPESEAAFRREMRMLGRLDHDNLVRAFDAGYDAMVYYLVTELVPGMDLKRHVQERGPLDEATAASVIAQAARGLGYAHEKGLVHRDVKPGNLLVMDDGRVKVLDLGLAGSQLEEESSRVGRVVGTMDYIAPEQIRAPDDVGPSADIYALGCTLYYAVTGRVPFPGGTRKEKMQRHLNDTPDPVRSLAPQFSDAFCRVIEAMMEKDPARRIGSAYVVIERLRPWLPRAESRALQPGPAAEQAVDVIRRPLLPPPLPSPTDTAGTATGLVLDPVLDIGGRLLAGIREVGVGRLARVGVEACLIAVPAGVVFGGAMSLVRGIDPQRFESLMGSVTPRLLGMAAFGLLFGLQVITGVKMHGKR